MYKVKFELFLGNGSSKGLFTQHVMHERQEIPLSHFLISSKDLISFGYVICKPQHVFICLIF